jgi:hypothetical protein
MRRPAFVALPAVALVALVAVARAGSSSRLVYSRAPEASSCPDESELRKAVAKRFGYDPFFPWAKQTVVVQIFRARGRFIARVQLLDEEGIAHGSRELSSNQGACSEIFEAAALAVSIALDAPAKPLTQEAAEAQSAPPSPPPAPTLVPLPPVAPPAASAAAGGEGEKPARPSDGGARMTIDVGLDLLGSFNTTPSDGTLSVTPAASVFVRGKLQMWSLALELLADYPGWATRATFPGGTVQAWVIAGGLAPCFRSGLFAVCAVGQAGSLQASGEHISPQSSRSTLFLTAGARLELEWPITETLALRARGEGVANLFRATLVLGDTDVWTASPVAGSLGAGLTAHFQ